jgi:Peptidase M1 N-terminal domain
VLRQITGTLPKMEKFKSSKASFKSFFTAFLLAFVVIFCLPFDKFLADDRSVSAWKDIKLPDFIHATDYKLNFKTNLNHSTFSGLVEIGLNITKKTKFIVVHNVDLELKFKHLQGPDSNHDLRLRAIKHYPELQYSILHFKKPLQTGHYSLAIHYDGVLNTNLAGYYISTYFDDQGIEHRRNQFLLM